MTSWALVAVLEVQNAITIAIAISSDATLSNTLGYFLLPIFTVTSVDSLMIDVINENKQSVP